MNKYDVVIAGGGAAGLMAALELGKHGKKVIVLEKGVSLASSNFAKAGGPAASETKIQKKEKVWLSNDALYKHMSKWANHTVNEALLKAVITCTGTAVNYMEEAGIEMELIPDTYGVGFRARHIIKTKAKERTEALKQVIESYGVKILCKMEVQKAIFTDGKITGVIAVNGNGETIFLETGVLLICTGGFQNNPEYIRRFFCIEHMVSLGNPLSTGDGIRMAEEAGAVTDRNFAMPGNEGSATTTKCKGYNDNLCFGLYGGLLTDHNGARFMNEKDIADFPLALGGEAFARHAKTYALVDETVYQACIREGIYSYMGEPENWIAGKALWHPVLKNAEKNLEKATSEGWALKANTIKKAAEYFQLPELEKTVKDYNAMCDAKEDTEFGKAANFLLPIKKAPFYIFEYEPACWCTIGGIKTDSRLNALDAMSRPISGLYVAGVDNGSMFCAPYYDNEGSALGLSLGSGIYAARKIMETD